MKTTGERTEERTAARWTRAAPANPSETTPNPIEDEDWSRNESPHSTVEKRVFRYGESEKTFVLVLVLVFMMASINVFIFIFIFVFEFVCFACSQIRLRFAGFGLLTSTLNAKIAARKPQRIPQNRIRFANVRLARRPKRQILVFRRVFGRNLHVERPDRVRVEQIVHRIAVHRVQSGDFPGLSCGVSVRNGRKQRANAVLEKAESRGVQRGQEGFARIRVKHRAAVGVQRERQCWREREEAKKGGDDLRFGLRKRLRSLRLTALGSVTRKISLQASGLLPSLSMWKQTGKLRFRSIPLSL